MNLRRYRDTRPGRNGLQPLPPLPPGQQLNRVDDRWVVLHLHFDGNQPLIWRPRYLDPMENSFLGFVSFICNVM
jgi:hypothetical protein